VQDEPYMMMKENAVLFTGNDKFEGYVADILRLVAASLRFDYQICLSTDGRYGEQNAAGQWNGIIGEVVRGVRTPVTGVNSGGMGSRDPSPAIYYIGYTVGKSTPLFNLDL